MFIQQVLLQIFTGRPSAYRAMPFKSVISCQASTVQRSCVTKDSSRLLLFKKNVIHVLWGNIPYIERYKQACRPPATLNSQIPQHEGYFHWSAIPAGRFNCAIQRRRAALFLPHVTERVPMVVRRLMCVQASAHVTNTSISISNSATIKSIAAVRDAALKNSGRKVFRSAED